MGKNLSFLELGKGIFDNMSDTKVKSMFVREKPAFVLCGMSGFFQSGANHGARCQSRQNPLGLSSEDRIWGQNVTTLALRFFFLYRMDIRVGQCVSQASQRQSSSAKLFCFIAPPFPLFPTHPPPLSHTFHMSQIYWPWKIMITCHLKFPSQLFPSQKNFPIILFLPFLL